MGGKRPKHDDLGEFQPENDGVDSSPFEGSIENDRKLGEEMEKSQPLF